MSTVRLVSYEEADAAVRAVYDDIRATRGSDFINNFWLALAADPALLKSTWEEVKTVMTAPGPLDPLTREMIYIAVSAANGCTYCAHSHTASAKAKGMTDAQYGDLLKVIALAGKTNHLANALQVPVDAAFEKSAG
ncbi:carboxymuconolactone decarboxylase family protein [Zhengella sp. ZM62]|uniref:carboxymuconolactone decarboxylase family protein n=1 Tax=Zhengella sedimenti TaxID=3390035 RepID=UPI003974EE53